MLISVDVYLLLILFNFTKPQKKRTMVSETGKSSNNNSLNKSSEEFFDKSRKVIETYSIIALFCLIAAILLISFDQKLLAGCLIIAGTSIGLIVVRKSSFLNKTIKESLNVFSSMNERKDDVIIDFSHRIR